MIAFAAWTLCCWILTALGGALRGLIAVYAVVVVAAAVVLFKGVGSPPAVRPPVGLDPLRLTSARVAAVAAGLATAGALAAVLLLDRQLDNLLPFWWCTVLLLGAAAWWVVRQEDPAPADGGVAAFPPRADAWASRAGLWALGVACVVLTLVAHRPDADDSAYVAFAVYAADHPDWPLWSSDPIFGREDWPLLLPVYRLHSYELANGALAYVSKIPAIYCFHVVSAGIAALFVPLAFARLFRLLAPRRWLWTTATAVLVLIAAGDVHRWYGNFAFVRMWQGKAIFLSVVLPLIYAYALQFGRRPTWRGGILLAAAQIAAVGCTSSAVWAAPASALAAVASAAPWSRRGLGVLALGTLTSAAVLAAGWQVRDDMQAIVHYWTSNPAIVWASSARTLPPGELLYHAFTTVLGRGRLLIFAVLSLLTAWAVLPAGVARRFAIAMPLASFLLLLNPYLAHWMVTHVIGGGYWRSMWVLPIPILMTLVLSAPLHWFHGVTRRPAGRLAATALVAAFVALVPSHSSLSGENQVELSWPGLKVPPLDYRLAAAINRSVEPGATVVAPPDVSLWIPTFHHHASPLTVRHYQDSIYLRAEDLEWRQAMTGLAGGTPLSSGAVADFERGLDRFDVRAVCLRDGEPAPRLRRALRTARFERTLRLAGHEIWVRSPARQQACHPHRRSSMLPPPV
ncbi:MAG: hypothetical protein D6696_09415 [Acidobacteria bacterium]|nr:MAG: hypothetical protein D6696_09415 [Acidobacteriota bacterium]